MIGGRQYRVGGVASSGATAMRLEEPSLTQRRAHLVLMDQVLGVVGPEAVAAAS